MFRFPQLTIAAALAVSCGGTTFSSGGTHESDSGTGSSGSGASAGTGGEADPGGGGGGTGAGAASTGGRTGAGGSAASGGTGTGGKSGAGGTSAGGVSAGGAGGRGNGGAAGSSSGGTAGSGGVPTCGEVAFKIVPGGPAGGSLFCTSPPNQCGGGAVLTVLDAEGHVVPMELGCGERTCTSCFVTGCTANCPQSSLIPAIGLGMNWLGTQWVGGTCGDGFACRAPKCVEHGSYVARLCGYALTTGSVGAGGTNGTAGGAGALPVPINPCEQSASKTPTCVEVPFEYPPTGVVSGVLDPSK